MLSFFVEVLARIFNILPWMSIGTLDSIVTIQGFVIFVIISLLNINILFEVYALIFVISLFIYLIQIILG